MVGNEVVIRKACEADFEFILEATRLFRKKVPIRFSKTPKD